MRKIDSVESRESDNEKHMLLKQLLVPHKTIRDAVHGDISVTRLETLIIDTHDFQRTRRLKQLGLTNLVYPSANHTRLEHGLGVVFMSERIIEKVNKNPYVDFKIKAIDRFIIRLCALLHDLETFHLATH